MKNNLITLRSYPKGTRQDVMNKKGVSAIIATVILIALVLVAATIIWSFVRNMVDERLEGADSCLNVFDKIKLNGLYTCYEKDTKDLLFSVSRENVNVTEIRVVVLADDATTIFKFDKDGVDDPTNSLEGYGGGDLAMPLINEGKTYVYPASFTNTLEYIQIAPSVGDKLCDVSDKIDPIPTCVELGL